MGHVNKVSHVFTLSHVAEMLGEDEDWLFEVAEVMDTEDGELWVVGVGEEGVMAFTEDGIENLKELIAIHKADPGIIEKRRQALAAMMKPKTEQSGEV
jgi:oligoribonuclease (3'-5' exoribonuclease)